MAGDGRVINNCILIAASGENMAINSIETAIHLTIREPAVKRRVAVIETDFWRLYPINRCCRIKPESSLVQSCIAIDLRIAIH